MSIGVIWMSSGHQLNLSILVVHKNAGEELYSWLEALLTELTDMLPSSMFHIGGDEVQYQCWQSSPKIVAYLAKRNMTGVQLYQEFEYRMWVQQWYLASMLLKLILRELISSLSLFSIGSIF